MKQTPKEEPSAPRIPRVLLLVESSRGSGRALLQGIARYAHHCGPWSCYWEPAGLEKAWTKLKASDFDGIIMRDVDQLDKVLAIGIPAVVIGHGRTEVPGMLNIVTESARIGQMAAAHLTACGFRHFAYCGAGPSPEKDPPWSRLRRQAFAETVRQAGWQCHDFAGEGSIATSGGRVIARTQLPLDAFKSFVRNTNGQMPPFRPAVLSDDDLDDIYAYLQSLPQPKAVSDIPLLGNARSQ